MNMTTALSDERPERETRPPMFVLSNALLDTAYALNFCDATFNLRG